MGGDHHAVFERAQLFQFFKFFKWRRRQTDKSSQRLSPPGIDTDMMPDRCRLITAMGYRMTAEIEHTATCTRGIDPAGKGNRCLDHLTECDFVSAGRGHRRGDISTTFGQAVDKAGQDSGVNFGQITLQIDDHIDLAVRINRFNRFVDAIRA